MYNGIGLQTARGSGTNGFVMKNLSFVRKFKDKVDYKSETEIAKLDASMHKPPNQEILNHERKRKIELKCMEMQELMEEQGYSDSEIDQKVSVFRQMLMENDAVVDEKIELDDLGRPIAKETHALQEANLAKNEAFKAALGLSTHYVDGSSLDPNRKAKEEAKRALEMAQTKYNMVQDSSSSESSRSPSPERKKKTKKREKSESPVRKEKKKKKHQKREREEEPKKKKKPKKKTKKHEETDSSESDSDDSDQESDHSPVRHETKFSPVHRRSRSLSYSPVRKNRVMSSITRMPKARSPSRSRSRSPARKSRHDTRREHSSSPVRNVGRESYSPDVKRKIVKYTKSSPPRRKKQRSPSPRRRPSRSPRRRQRSASSSPSPKKRSRSPRRRQQRSVSKSPSPPPRRRHSRSPKRSKHSRSRSPTRKYSKSRSPSPRRHRSKSPRKRRHSRDRY